MEQAMSQEKALLLNTEIAAVVTAMRQNSKWAVIPRYNDEEIGEDPLLEEFKNLRRKVFRWTDWSVVEALEYLSPFLEVVRSAETSGPITAMALSSVNKLISAEIIGSSAGSSQGLALAMHNTSEAVTHCKFESTDASSDEVVLSKILQVLLACIKCPTGKYLSDSDVCNIFQACFRIGHGHPPGKEGELLTQMSRSILSEMVSVIFGRLGELQDASAVQSEYDAHAIRTASTGDFSVFANSATAAAEGAEQASAAAGDGAAADPSAAEQPGDKADSTADSSGSTEDVQDMAYPRPVPGGSMSQSNSASAEEVQAAAASAMGVAEPAEGEHAGEGPLSQGAQIDPSVRHVISLSKSDANLIMPEQSSSPTTHVPVWQGYGIGCATEVLGFLVSLVGAPGMEADEIRVFGLDLINIALSSGRGNFMRHEVLMDILQTDLFQAMHRAARSGNLAALSGSCSVSLSLYVYLGKRMLLQLETFIGGILLRIAEGKGCSYEQQEAALEGILDLCHQAAFVRDAYANLDCRIERTNVFEDICALLSRTAFPINCPLRSIHLISLEGLLAVLSTLSAHTDAPGDEEDQVLTDSGEYTDIWTGLVEGREPLMPISEEEKVDPSNWVRAVQREKYLKGRLSIAADHFNRDPKKGFQFLQTMKLLPDPLEPKAVAHFLRSCPGLHKDNIGTLLGEVDLKKKERDGFYLKVLEHFTQSFDFTGLKFDSALRMYLESFKLPGEAQKIDRIVQAFGNRYYEQNESVLRNADAAYVLGYSVIMLNTDAHNNQVKKKMSLQDFTRNNRGINDGEDLPYELQEELYYSIVTNEIKLDKGDGAAQAGGAAVGAAKWAPLRRASMLPRGQLCRRGPSDHLFDRDMFCLIWGPTVAAISVVLDHTDDPAVMRQSLDGLTLAARIAAQHSVDEVMDSIVVSLCKFTNVLNPNTLKATVAFGEDLKARQAAETVFMLANRYGDCLRAGWRNILDVVVRIHKLGVLPASVFLFEGEDKEVGMKRIPVAQASKPKGQSTSVWFSFNQIISFDDGRSNSGPTPRESEAEQRTLQCIETCRIDEIFCDSKFLRAESLVELVRSIIWASGVPPPQPSGHNAIMLSEEDNDTAEVCLELLIGITIRNRDRIELLWPSVHAHLEAIIRSATHPASPLVERAVLGLLRVCQRLLPYKEDISDELLRSLHLIFRLDPKVAEDLAEVITGEVLGLVKGSAAFIRSEWGWNTVCALMKAASHHPGAFPMAFEALAILVQDNHLMKQNFLPCLETALAFIDNSQKQNSPERAKQVIDLLEGMNSWLVSSAENVTEDKHQYTALWLTLIRALCKQVVNEADPNLRNHSVVVLHRIVSPELTEGLGLPANTWGAVFQEELLPLVSQLAALHHSSQGAPEVEHTLRLSVNMLSKTLLQCLPVLRSLDTFPAIWVSTLTVLQDCTKTHSEELTEAVPENLKNMLRYLHHQRVLVPQWQDAEKGSLWELTWKKSQAISTGLTPQVLEGTGF